MHQPNAIGARYSRQRHVDRLITVGRAALAGFFLLAILLDPSEPSRYAQITYAILVAYFVYAVLSAIILWHMDIPRGASQIVAHAIDLVIFAIVMFFTEGPTSPFFAFFVFCLVSAALRWQWKGTIWTAAASLSFIILLAFYPKNLFNDPDFQLNQFIIRVVYLAVVAVILGYLGAYEYRLRGEISKLAAWPRAIPVEYPPLLQETLEHAAGVLAAPRLLLVYEEVEEPYAHVASWSHGQFDYAREPPSESGTRVAEPLADASFFCSDTRAPNATVVFNSPAGLLRWKGNPLDSWLQGRFDIRSVLALRLSAEHTDGHLFALDMRRMTSDDLILGDIIANEVTARLEQFHLLKQLQQVAASEERVRLARNLHDSLLQSLTALGLQIETFDKLMEADPQAAREHLSEIQRLIATQRGELRHHIQELRSTALSLDGMDTGLIAQVEELAEQINRHWGLRVKVNSRRITAKIPQPLGHEIYLIVHESLINAARHSKASAVTVELTADYRRVHIAIADNGRGFPFRGRYNQAALARMNRGPVTLRERIASLGGSLIVDSKDTGARLEITVPLPDRKDQDVHSSRVGR